MTTTKRTSIIVNISNGPSEKYDEDADEYQYLPYYQGEARVESDGTDDDNGETGNWASFSVNNATSKANLIELIKQTTTELLAELEGA